MDYAEEKKNLLVIHCRVEGNPVFYTARIEPIKFHLYNPTMSGLKLATPITI